jgi:hypothetical protein
MTIPVQNIDCVGHISILKKIVQIKTKPPDSLLNFTTLGNSKLLPKVAANMWNQLQELGITNPAQESIIMPHWKDKPAWEDTALKSRIPRRKQTTQGRFTNSTKSTKGIWTNNSVHKQVPKHNHNAVGKTGKKSILKTSCIIILYFYLFYNFFWPNPCAMSTKKIIFEPYPYQKALIPMLPAFMFENYSTIEITNVAIKSKIPPQIVYVFGSNYKQRSDLNQINCKMKVLGTQEIIFSFCRKSYFSKNITLQSEKIECESKQSLEPHIQHNRFQEIMWSYNTRFKHPTGLLHINKGRIERRRPSLDMYHNLVFSTTIYQFDPGKSNSKHNSLLHLAVILKIGNRLFHQFDKIGISEIIEKFKINVCIYYN